MRVWVLFWLSCFIVKSVSGQNDTLTLFVHAPQGIPVFEDSDASSSIIDSLSYGSQVKIINQTFNLNTQDSFPFQGYSKTGLEKVIISIEAACD